MSPHDEARSENLIICALARADWQHVLQSGLTRHSLMSFHARYKYQLMAQNPAQYKVLGKLLGSMGHADAAQLGPRYFNLLVIALELPATRGTHANALLHLSGYLRKAISRENKQEIRRIIEQYLNGDLPLQAPIDLLNHHFGLHPDPYVLKQVYLQPHPESARLRNAI
jgi:uncharacterized protein YbgA (DUF1722 family)